MQCGVGVRRMATAKGSARKVTLRWPRSLFLLWRQDAPGAADLQLFLSPGKVTSGNLGNSKAWRRQGKREVKASCNIHGTMTEHSLAL